jgi:hypothetical protein
MALRKQNGVEKTPCPCKKVATSKREKALVCFLLWLTFIWGVFWVCDSFKDYNRYSLEIFQNMDRAIAYKIDKKTGKVTAIADLLEFPVDPFEEVGVEANWAWPNRSEASSELLY